MKKLCAVVFLTGILGGLLPGVHARPTRQARVEKASYAASTDLVPMVYTNLGQAVAEVGLPAGPERYLRLAITDDAGGQIAVEVIQGVSVTEICSASDTIRIVPGQQVTLRLFAGRCPDGTPSTPTRGAIEATFTTSPPDTSQTQGYSPFIGGAGYFDGRIRVASVRFQTLGRRVGISVSDASTSAVYGVLRQGGSSVEGGTELARFCGRTEAPVKVAPDLPLWVDLWSGPPCGPGGPSIATRGIVQAEFSR